MREGPPAEGLRPRPVGDGPAHELGRPRDDPTCRQRLGCVGGELGLDPDDADARPEAANGCGDAARQPTATDRHEHARQVRQVLGDLQAARPLAGDDPIVVVRGDDGEPALGGDPLRGHPPLLARRPDHHDLGTVRLDARPLHGRRIAGHDDDGRRAEQPRGARHALCVVPGRVRDDAARAHLRREAGHRVVGATQLERADGLERLGLEEPATLGRPERHERRPHRDALEDPGGGTDPVQADERLVAERTPGRHRWARARWQSMQ